MFLRRRVVRDILGKATADALAVACGAVLDPSPPEPVISGLTQAGPPELAR
jgi:hypothetical protein